MRVRSVLRFAFGLAAAAAVAGCSGGHAVEGDGHAGGPGGYHPNPRAGNVIILVDSGCNPMKTDPGVGFSKNHIRWHILSQCSQYNAHDVYLVFTDLHGNSKPPIDNCPCKGTIDQNGVMDLPLEVGEQRAGFYTYELRLDDPNGKKLIDPDLEIDP